MGTARVEKVAPGEPGGLAGLKPAAFHRRNPPDEHRGRRRDRRRMQNSLAIFAWLKAIWRNEIAARRRAAFEGSAGGIKMALRSRMEAAVLGTLSFWITAKFTSIPLLHDDEPQQ